MAAQAPAPFHRPAQLELQQQLLLAPGVPKGSTVSQGTGSRALAAAHQGVEERACAVALNGWATRMRVKGR
jgi:hypothetical protein